MPQTQSPGSVALLSPLWQTGAPGQRCPWRPHQEHSQDEGERLQGQVLCLCEAEIDDATAFRAR